MVKVMTDHLPRYRQGYCIHSKGKNGEHITLSESDEQWLVMAYLLHGHVDTTLEESKYVV